jgi:hypothetical protein
MLINPANAGIAAGDVVSVKLIHGEEILAKLVDINGDDYTFERPVILALVPVGNGQAAVNFAPFSMGIDDTTKLVINYSRMLFRPVAARQDAAAQYIKSTTGIELA